MSSGCHTTLHIEYDAEIFDGDWTVTCKVTYPAVRQGQKPITVDYVSQFYDVTPDQVKAYAFKDIAEYMDDPGAWTAHYLTHRSTDVGLKLEEAKREYDYYLKAAQDKEESATHYRRCASQVEARMQELQAQLPPTEKEEKPS